MNMRASADEQKSKRGRMHRLPGADLSMAEEIFKSALLLLVPDDQTQRKAFETLMPYLYVLRNKGSSWEQLTKLLNDCGFKLQPSTVRNYFGEMQRVHMEICQQRMNEQILLMNEVKKQTSGVDVSKIAGQISGIMERNRAAAGPKIESMFGLAASGEQSGLGQGHVRPGDGSAKQNSTIAAGNYQNNNHATGKVREPASPAPLKTRVPASPAHVKTGEPASPALPKNDAGHRPASKAHAEDDHGFGLLVSSAPVASASRPAFFDLDDGPAIPVLTAPSARAAQPDTKAEMTASPQQGTEPNSTGWRCRQLTPGVTPIKKKPNVPAEVYEDGLLEHPAVPGVMLTLEQRLYGTSLEFVDSDAEVHIETIDQKRFRVMWRTPIPTTPTVTSRNFTDMDLTLFDKKP